MPGFNMKETEWSKNLWERCKKVFQAHNTRITALEQGGGGGGSVTVTDGDPTLAWGTRSTVGTVDSTSLHVTMPAKPAYTAQDVGALPSNTTYVSGVKGDAENAYRSGQVNLTPANIGAVATSDIVNNLTSTATDKPLSAAQGKALNDKITTYKNGDVIRSDRVLFGYCAGDKIARFYHATQKIIPSGATLTIAGSISALYTADGTSITVPSGATLDVTRSNDYLYYIDIKGLSGLSSNKACYARLSNGNITVSIS